MSKSVFIPNRFQDGEIEKKLVFAYSMKKIFE